MIPEEWLDEMHAETARMPDPDAELNNWPSTEQLREALAVMDAWCEARDTCTTALAVSGHHTGMCIEAESAAKRATVAYVAKWGHTRSQSQPGTALGTPEKPTEPFSGRSDTSPNPPAPTEPPTAA